MSESRYSLSDLLRVMERLRNPHGGCPWDLRQDFSTIVPSTLEECYELVQAIEHEDSPHIAEELGDVLFQVVFYAQLGREKNLFCFDDIVDTLVKKLIRRHPHVFAQGQIEGVVSQTASVQQVKASWEAIKHWERSARAQPGVLDDVPVALPALPRAQKLQKRAAAVNFDWPDAAAALDKLQEEVDELREAINARDVSAVADEMGDVLFSQVNVARLLGVDAETCLRRAATRFEQRFRHMEAAARDSGLALDRMTATALDALWESAKRDLHRDL